MVLAAALVVMPLQSIATSLSPVVCHGDAQAHSTHAESGHDGSHDTRHDDGGAPEKTAYHLCCHFTVSPPSAVTLPAPQPDGSVRAFTPDAPLDRYFPDQPQRPPLA